MSSQEEFEKELDEFEKRKKENEVIDPKPSEVVQEEVDPLAHLIGRQSTEDDDRDPFEAMITNMLLQEGVAIDGEVASKQPDVEEHEWEFISEMKFEDDEAMVVCVKCARHMRVLRSKGQTIMEAMVEHKVDKSCALVIVSTVQDV